MTPEQAARMCDRNFGIGGDGVIFALPPVGDVDFTMRIYNSDGSEPEMCGNGIRCLARFISDLDNAPPRKYKIHTLAGAPCVHPLTCSYAFPLADAAFSDQRTMHVFFMDAKSPYDPPCARYICMHACAASG